MARILTYENVSRQNCVDEIHDHLFGEKHGNGRTVATLNVDNDFMVHVHNHLNSSTSWMSVSQWETRVKYTIRHPDGDITAMDFNRGVESSINRESNVVTFNGICNSKNFRIENDTVECLDPHECKFNMSQYSGVKIESVKTFRYESQRSSWIFSLAIVWKGATKMEAELSEKLYEISIFSGDMEKSNLNSKYSTVSILEKVIDICICGNEHPDHKKQRPKIEFQV